MHNSHVQNGPLADGWCYCKHPYCTRGTNGCHKSLLLRVLAHPMSSQGQHTSIAPSSSSLLQRGTTVLFIPAAITRFNSVCSIEARLSCYHHTQSHISVCIRIDFIRLLHTSHAWSMSNLPTMQFLRLSSDYESDSTVCRSQRSTAWKPHTARHVQRLAFTNFALYRYAVLVVSTNKMFQKHGNVITLLQHNSGRNT